MDKEKAALEVISEADNIVLAAMQSYLRTCRSGGMPNDLSKRIEAAVTEAARLQYFTFALAEKMFNKTNSPH